MLKGEGELVYECCEIFDFTNHKLEAIIENDWDYCKISSRAVTYNEVVY